MNENNIFKPDPGQSTASEDMRFLLESCAELVTVQGTDNLGRYCADQLCAYLGDGAVVLAAFDSDDSREFRISALSPRKASESDSFSDLTRIVLDRAESTASADEPPAPLRENRELFLGDIPSQWASSVVRVVPLIRHGTNLGAVVLILSQEIPYKATTTIRIFLDQVAASLAREKVEEALAGVEERSPRETDERYRTILDSISEGYFETDLEGKIVFCNDVVPAIHGVSREEFLQKTHEDYMTPKSIYHIGRDFRELYRSGVPKIIRNYEIIAPDGARRVHEFSMSILPDLLGNPVGFRGVVRDVTDQRRIEQALRESEERYRTILEGIEEGFFEVDLAGCLIFCNDGLPRMHNMSREDFLALNFRDYMTPESADRAYQTFNRVFRTGDSSDSGEYDVITHDGRSLIHELSVSLVRNKNGKPVGFRGLVRDVTERRRVERELAANEKRYRTILDNVGTAVIVVENNVITFANTEFAALWGYDRHEIEGVKEWIDFVHSEDRGRILEVVDDYLNEPGGKVRHVPVRFVAKSGDLRHTHAAISWIPGTTSTLVSLNDMTEYKRLEACFIEAQKMEAVGTLAGGIAHNFNNLLMGIQGNASLMLMDTEGSHGRQRRLQRIEDHVRAGADLTAQLLGFARGGKYEVIPTDLAALIDKTTDMFESTRRDIRVYRKYDADLWVAEVDRSQIEQVLLNILLNAWQAMPGGGDIEIIAENVSCPGSATLAAGKYVEISIVDSGVGMDEATREHIFEPFFSTREPERGRTGGLGLASAYGIVKSHGGAITVDTESGQGSAFHVFLPALPVAESVKEETPHRKLFRGTERILVVDDEPMVLEVASDILQSLGYDVATADCGFRALEMFNGAPPPDLVVLDLVMPDMNGGEVFDRIRKIAPGTRVLLVSGYSLEGQASVIMDRGCDGFIQKPFDVKGLSKAVRDVLGRS